MAAKPTFERYTTTPRSCTDTGFVYVLNDPKTGAAEEQEESFDEVAEMNRLWNENQALKAALRRAKRK